MEVESNFKIKNTLEIGVANNVAPIITNSSILVTNLNADLLDGLDSTAFQPTLISGSNIKTVNGNSLLGSDDITISGTVSVTDDTTTDATYYPVLGTSATGSLNARASSTKLTYNPSTGTLSATSMNVTTPPAGDNSTKVATTEFVVENTTKKSKKSFLIYYGYPIAYKGLWDIDSVIMEISKFNCWVVGGTYEDPNFSEHDSTQSIISGVQANGVKVYGYVATHNNGSDPISTDTISTNITNWKNLGVDGIFLDEFGFDYGNTRQRQIDIVNLVYNASLPYIGNAWLWSEVMCDNVNQLPWPNTDWRYIQFTNGNPNNLSLPRSTLDGYLFENYGITETGAQDEWEFHERVQQALAINDSYSHMILYAVSVIGENPTGTPNMSLYPQFADFEVLNRYIITSSFLHNIDYIGIGGYSFGSNGIPLDFNMYSLPANAGNPTTINWNYTTGIFTRYYGKYLIKVQTIGTTFYSEVSSDYGENLVTDKLKTINGQNILGSGNIVTSVITNITVNILKSTYSANILINDASVTTTSRIFAIPNGFTSGGLLGGDELEMTPLIINAYCTVNGTINMIISSSQGPIKGTYGISYSIQ